MMEPAELPPMKPLKTVYPEWAVSGAVGRERTFLSSIYLNPPEEEEANLRMARRWLEVKANEVRYKEYYWTTPIVVVGFGSRAGGALSGAPARAEGIKVGLLRPISLSPFPGKGCGELSKVESMLVVEMNTGQMLEDVRWRCQGGCRSNSSLAWAGSCPSG